MLVGEAAVFDFLGVQADCTQNPTSGIVSGYGRVHAVGQQTSEPNFCCRGGRDMNRRDFLQSGVIVSAGLAFAKPEGLFSQVTALDRWRTFQVTTRVEVLKTSGTTRVWVPAALIGETPFQKTLTNTFNCEGGTAKMVESI